MDSHPSILTVEAKSGLRAFRAPFHSNESSSLFSLCICSCQIFSLNLFVGRSIVRIQIHYSSFYFNEAIESQQLGGYIDFSIYRNLINFLVLILPFGGFAELLSISDSTPQ